MTKPGTKEGGKPPWMKVKTEDENLREAVENLLDDVDEIMADKPRLHDLQQRIGAVFLGYGGGYNHEDDLRAALGRPE